MMMRHPGSAQHQFLVLLGLKPLPTALEAWLLLEKKMQSATEPLPNLSMEMATEALY
jgi:hypothetical protein